MRLVALAAAAAAAVAGAVLEVLAVRAGTGWSAGEAVLDLLAGWSLLAATAARGLSRGARGWCAAAAALWLLATLGLLGGEPGRFGSSVATLWLAPLSAAVLAAPRGWPPRAGSRCAVVAAGIRGAVPGLAASPLVTVAVGVAIAAAAARDVVALRAVGRPAGVRSTWAARSGPRWAAVLLGAVCAAGGLAQATGSGVAASDRLLSVAVLLCGAALLAMPALTGNAGAVSQLVVDLGRTRDTRTQQQLLGESLGDPAVRLLVRLDPERPWVDLAGSPAATAWPAGRVLTDLTTSSQRPGGPAVALEHAPGALDDPDLRRAALAVGALIGARLTTTAVVARQARELAASRRQFVAAETAERSLLARQVADGPGRRLDEADRLLERALAAAPPGRQQLRDDLVRARGHLDGGRADLRSSVTGDLSFALSRRGLAAALHDLAAASGASGDVDLGPVGTDARADIAETAWFVASEACTNALRHAGPARIWLRARRMAQVLVVEVEDDGTGGADPAGRGLRGLRDRVLSVGGELEVTDGARGGTLVIARLPL